MSLLLDDSKFCFLSLHCKFQTNIGETLVVSGNLLDLGDWNIARSLRLETSSELYPEWRTKTPVRVIKNSTVEFKFAVVSTETGELIRWEVLPGDTNRVYHMKWFKAKLSCVQGELRHGEIIEMRFRGESQVNFDEKVEIGMSSDAFAF